MARIRSIKPEFWTSAQVLECSRNARLLFVGLWNFCDDKGRHPYSAKQAKAEVFPSDDLTEAQVYEMLQELSMNDLITVYQFENKQYFYVTGWHHQRIDKPQEPKYPDPFSEHSKNVLGTIPPDRIGEDKIGEEGKESTRAQARPVIYAFEGKIVRLNQKHFDNWVKAYPNLDLRGELTARDAWLGGEAATNEDRKNWFASTAQHLANRNMKAKSMKPNGEVRRGIEGIT